LLHLLLLHLLLLHLLLHVFVGVVQAIRLLSQLSARMPDIVHLLQPNFDDTAAVILRQGFAQVCCWLLGTVGVIQMLEGSTRLLEQMPQVAWSP
jgi:hypothetical protein